MTELQAENGGAGPPAVARDPQTGLPYDPETGEVLTVRAETVPPRALRSYITVRQGMPKLDTADAIDAEIQRELYKLDLVGKRLSEVRQLIHGYYTEDGYVAGVEFEIAQVSDRVKRNLWRMCHDTRVPKDERPKWPGEDARDALVNEAVEAEGLELLERSAALKGELDSLADYRRITESRLNGLQSLLAYKREEARLEAQSGS